MNPVIAELDPRVEELLRSIAADPESRLLRVDRRSLQRELRVEPASVGIATAGLTAAERQLVQVHRLEVVELLKQCVGHLLLSDHAQPRLMSCYDTRRGVDCAPTATSLRDGVSALEAAEGDCSDALDLIRRCIDAGSDAPVAPGQLATAALRLQARADLVLVSGLCFLHSGEFQHALTQIGRSIGVGESRRNQACAWIDAGRAFWELRRPNESLKCYVHATQTDPHRLAGWLGRLSLAGKLGVAPDVVRCAREIAETAAGNCMVVDWYVESLRKREGDGRAAWSSEIRRLPGLVPISTSSDSIRRLVDAHQ